MSIIWLECDKCGDIHGFVNCEEEMIRCDCERDFCDVSYLYQQPITDEDKPF